MGRGNRKHSIAMLKMPILRVELKDRLRAAVTSKATVRESIQSPWKKLVDMCQCDFDACDFYA